MSKIFRTKQIFTVEILALLKLLEWVIESVSVEMLDQMSDRDLLGVKLNNQSMRIH